MGLWTFYNLLRRPFRNNSSAFVSAFRSHIDPGVLLRVFYHKGADELHLTNDILLQIAQRLLEAGYAVVRFDHRGHGRSMGKKVWYDDRTQIVSDTDLFVE